jgi:formylglycine-generating enzyme required for sulfatase activity
VNSARLVGTPLLLAFFASCSSPPATVAVTLTAPVPTATAPPFVLVPVVELGSSFVHMDGTTLVAIPNGEFLMGRGSADNPEHRVILSDYWIYSTEVTNSQYALCVAQGWCSEPDPDDNSEYQTHLARHRPVVGVSYDQATSYCSFVSGDLPTEAQWEKAARGVDARPYPWGQAEPSCELANYANCLKRADEVMSRQDGRSPYGAVNLAGNVLEWVGDWYDPIYYENSPPGDPPGPPDGRTRVIRSSGFRSSGDQLVVYGRFNAAPADHRPDLGFRCVVQQPAGLAPACRLAPVVPADRTAGASVSCPQISIDVQVTACRYGGGAVVTFNNDQEHDPDASFGGIVGCTLLSGTPGSYPISYACRRPSTAVMTTRCSYQGVPDGDCPPGYMMEASSRLCRWNGAPSLGIECPTGEFYDPVSHCCSITTGDPTDFPVCPVGSTFTEIADAVYACLPAELVSMPPAVSERVDPPVCGDICELTVELCSIRNLVFCPTTCACLAVGRTCPDP